MKSALVERERGETQDETPCLAKSTQPHAKCFLRL